METSKHLYPIQPWNPADATIAINKIANLSSFSLLITKHAEDRMLERSLIMGDILYVLKKGYVYSEPEQATREGYFKYSIESKSPNSNRIVRVVTIPDTEGNGCKIVTVMWKDE